MEGYEIDRNSPAHQVVFEVGQMHMEGNIIPASWFACLRYEGKNGKPGKPNTNAIIILSEIVYWYRPMEVRDEVTGRTLGYRKKFKGDILQRSRASFETQFGFTKKQVSDALAFLEARGIVRREITTVDLPSGTRLGNVLYLALIPEKLREITYSRDTPLSPGSNRGTPTGKRVAPTSKSLLPESKTYTEITPETTQSGGVANPSQTTPPPQLAVSDDALKRVGYDAGQRRKIHAARSPLTDQEIADIPGYIASLKRAGKRNPIGIVYNELIDGRSIPHPEDVVPAEAPLEFIYTDDGRAIPKDPERHARIQAQRKADLAAAGYR